MTERSRIFTFNIIESRPLCVRARGREWASARGRADVRANVRASIHGLLAVFNTRNWKPRNFRDDCCAGDRGHAFLSSRCANTRSCVHVYVYATESQRHGQRSIDSGGGGSRKLPPRYTRVCSRYETVLVTYYALETERREDINSFGKSERTSRLSCNRYRPLARCVVY